MRNGLFSYMYQIMKETEVVVNRGKSVAIKKIFFSTSDLSGGAAGTAYWLARGLVNKGEELLVCVQEKTGANPRVWQVKKRDMGNSLDQQLTFQNILNK